jgi:hypothetical protein
MQALNKAGCMVLVAGLLRIAGMPANAQQEIRDGSNEKGCFNEWL